MQEAGLNQVQFGKKYNNLPYRFYIKKELDKNLLQTTLEEITKNYDHYIKEEMMADDSTLEEDKIINTVKKEYFVNNINV